MGLFRGFIGLATALFGAVVVAGADDMPLPFTRSLNLTTPLLEGNDVLIVQNLLNRAVSSNILANGGDIPITGLYDNAVRFI